MKEQQNWLPLLVSLREALAEWSALAEHQGLSTTRHRDRTKNLIKIADISIAIGDANKLDPQYFEPGVPLTSIELQKVGLQ